MSVLAALEQREYIRWQHVWMVVFASAARLILEVSQGALTPIFTCCYSKVASEPVHVSGKNTTQWRSDPAGRQVVLSGCTAAAQYGLYLSVTHKPFRAATASPELLGIEALPQLFTYFSTTSSQMEADIFRQLLRGGQGVQHLKHKLAVQYKNESMWRLEFWALIFRIIWKAWQPAGCIINCRRTSQSLWKLAADIHHTERI